MADDNRIEIVARLDTSRAAVVKIEADLSKITDQLNKDQALKIIANVDLSKTTQRINSQLATIGKNLKLDIGNIKLDTNANKAVEQMKSLGKAAGQTQKEIKKVETSLANIGGTYIDPLEPKSFSSGRINADATIAALKERLSPLGTVTATGKYGTGEGRQSLEGITAEIKSATGEVRTLTFAWDEFDKKFYATSSRYNDKGVLELLNRQETQVDKLTQKLDKLKAGFDNANAPRPILKQENIDQLNEEYSKTDKIIKQIGNSTTETFNKSVREANKAIISYENLGKAMRDAENTATELSSNDIGSAKSLLGGNIDKFIGQVSKSSITDSNVIIGKAEEIKKSLNDIGDAHGLKIARDNLNKLRGEFDSLNAQAKSASFAETLKNRVEKLSATMSAFAEKNERAVKSVQTMSSGKTFAQEWQELSNALSKGGLNPDDLRHLQERFAIFGKEAEAAGLKGKTAWEKFLGTFRTFSSYITANMVFNVFKRQISSMVQEVISLDSAMTELRKVTEATEPEFNKFLETAKQSAQYLGSSVTDLVDATSTFSRLGYSLSEAQNLGEVATLYKNVGDGIDISTASESIVSTLKAFKIEAEDAIGIVDKLNEVGNNFAISSGGIGEALLRSASAMAAANNDLSQSIALITTANTIAQNPESVGTGLKTMALRLRSTKTEIEEMGEDAEGAAENVSKLREQVLALTKNKVDIQLDENTYKSSYDILLEISKVWNELNDMSRASLLEQLFGKRQANVGAAILENGELLQQVYETAEHSIGSATKEQEKFSKSIQYSINSFKAAYQSFASDVIGSDFVKSIVDLGSTIVKGLDFIITKTGILQGILVGFGSLAIFKTISTLSTKLKTIGTSIASFSSIMGALDSSGKGSQIMTTNQLALASKNLSDRQFELVLSTKNLTEAQLTEMMAARGFTQEQIQAQLAIRNQTVATNGLATAEQTATATTFSFGGAIKGLGAIIAANPIGAIITGVTVLTTVFTSFKRKQEEAIVEAKRLEEERQRNLQTTVDELKTFEGEQESINGLTKRYAALANTTENIVDAKDELTSITDELNGKFGDEKFQIDLINGSLSENIALIREQQDELDRQWQRDNKSNIEEAEKFVTDNNASLLASYQVNGARVGEGYDEAVKEAKFYFDRMKHLIDESDKDLWQYLETVEETTTDKYGYMVNTYGFKLKEGLDRDVIPEISKSFRELYEQLDKYSYIDFKWFEGTGDSDALNQYISDWDKYLEIIHKNEEINNKSWDNASIALDGTLDEFNKLIDAASEASGKMNASDILPADVYIYSRQLNDIKAQLEELAKNSPELQKRLSLVFSTIGLQAEDVSESADLLRKKFFDTLDEMQKGVFAKVDKINDAITKMLSGEGLSSAEAWELLDIDTTGILTPIINANGEWIMQSEQLVALKERLVGLSREQVQSDLNTAQNQIANLDRQIADQYAIIKEQQEIISKTRGNSKPNEENIRLLRQAKNRVGELLEEQKKYSDEVKRDNLLLQELNSKLAMSAKQLEKVVDNLNKELDNYVKAYEKKIDGIVDSLELEQKELENQKQTLQDELDILNEQKDVLEDTIKNYDSVNKIVQDTVKKEIDSLEEQKKAIEDSYNKRIDALKAENKEREDALDYAQRLKNLENAQNNKSRVYDEARGWHWTSNSDDIKKAENDLHEYENRKAIEQLEAERDALIEATEDIIDSRTKYAEQWEEASDSIQNEADEELAKEILGADWREKIANGDIKLLNDFSAQYATHNTRLRVLTNTEIGLKNQAIDAKDAEIAAKKEQIESWKSYKTTVTTAVQDIKDANDGYMEQLGNINLNEASSLEDRERAFATFKEKVTGYVNSIAGAQNDLNGVQSELEYVKELQDGLGGTIHYDVEVDGVDKLEKAAAAGTVLGVGSAMMVANNPISQITNDVMDAVSQILSPLRGFSQGGVADYTGAAMLHGRKNAPETIFNAKDSAKLYDMVHNTPNLMANAINEAQKLTGFKLNNNSSTNSSSVEIGSINVYANNPQEFTKGLDQHLDRYFQQKLTASYTSR